MSKQAMVTGCKDDWPASSQKQGTTAKHHYVYTLNTQTQSNSQSIYTQRLTTNLLKWASTNGYKEERKWKSLSCVWLCDPMVYTVHGILQARMLEWVAVPFSRGSSQPRDQTQVSCITGRFFTSWATREAQEYWSGQPIPSPADLPTPGIKLGSPALHVDSLPTELSGKPTVELYPF